VLLPRIREYWRGITIVFINVFIVSCGEPQKGGGVLKLDEGDSLVVNVGGEKTIVVT